jgi:hypothetical protein
MSQTEEGVRRAEKGSRATRRRVARMASNPQSKIGNPARLSSPKSKSKIAPARPMAALWALFYSAPCPPNFAPSAPRIPDFRPLTFRL